MRVDLNNKNDRLRGLQERTRSITKYTVFGYFFQPFLGPVVYIPHPGATKDSLRNQNVLSA